MGFRKRFLVVLLCIGLLASTAGCGKSDGEEMSRESTGQESASQGSTAQEGTNTDYPIQGGASVLLTGSTSSPVYSKGLRTDNGKDPYMAAVREKLEMETPQEYLDYMASEGQDDEVQRMSGWHFLGMSVGGRFMKWFWFTKDGKATGVQYIAAADVYGAKAVFQPDAKLYSSDPERTGMVKAVGGIAGQSGYVMVNYGWDAKSTYGVSIVGEGGSLLAHYELPPENNVGERIMADRDFRLYALDENNRLIIYDTEGKTAAEDSSLLGKGFPNFTAFPDGTVGVFCGDSSFSGSGLNYRGALYQVDPEGGECILLEERKSDTLFMTEFGEGSFLYASGKGIYRCPYDSQEEEALYLWENHGLNVVGVEGMSAEPDGSIDALIETAEGSIYYLHLVPVTEEIETIEITFAVSEAGRQRYLEPIYRFNREHPAYLVTMEVYEEETKLVTELTAGKGPVLVDTDVVDFNANWKLWENLDGKLEEWGLKDLLVEKAVQRGQIDGKQYGMVFAWSLYSFVTDCCDAESWDYEAFMAYLRDHPELERIYPEQWPENFMNQFLLRSLEDSYFVDAEEGKAHFDSEEFAEAAAIAKKLEVAQPWEELADYISKVRSGKYLGDFAYLYCLDQLAYYREIYGEDANFIGFPGRDGSKHFLFTAAPVAVRSTASEEEKQVAFWLLSEMLGEEAQLSNGTREFSVRKDIFEEQLAGPEEGTKYLIGGEAVQLEADWDAVREELLAIYEKSVPDPGMPKAVEAAISEGLAEYFDGTKSAEEAGAILQNRVQLYLDERN